MKDLLLTYVTVVVWIVLNNLMLFIYPPLCYPVSPYISVPYLVSILQEHDYNAACCDFNVQYYNERILNKDFVFSCYKRIKNNIELIKQGRFIFKDENEKYIINSSVDFLELFLSKKDEVLRKIDFLDSAVKDIKSKTDFYNISRLDNSVNIINNAEKIVLFSYFHSDILKKNIGSKFSKIDYFSANERLNPFYDFFLQKIKNNFFDKYKIVLISQPFALQTFASFTLGRLLNEHTNIKVCIGGNYTSRLSETFKNNTKIFEKYFDYIMCGLGEEAIIKFAEFIKGKEKPENVPGLIWINKGKISSTPPDVYLRNPNKRTLISFDGINFNDYLSPEVVVPIQVSKGCPWGKCTFCIFHEGKPIYQIVPPKQAAKEFKYYYDKYGITKFEFVDESLTPKYYYDFAKEIIKLGIKIDYYGFARFDDNFTPEILDTMHKSGFRIFEWGYETPSKRIMEIYNKGIDSDKRLLLLERADKAGILNYCLTIVNVPFETVEEEIEDFNIYEKYYNLFHSRLIASFELYKNAPIAKNAERFNMTDIKDNGDLSIALSYKRKDKQQYEADRRIMNISQKLYKKYAMCAWNRLISSADEYLLLYVAKHGKEKVLKMKIKEELK